MTRVVIILSSDNIMTIVDHERFSDVLLMENGYGRATDRRVKLVSQV